MSVPQVGDVFIGYIPIAEKNKRFVVLSKAGSMNYCLLFNSELNQSQLILPELRRMKFQFQANQDRLYLDHDSFVDCEAFIQMDDRAFWGDRFRWLGKMTAQDLALIIKYIINIGLYSDYELEDSGIFVEDFIEA